MGKMGGTGESSSLFLLGAVIRANQSNRPQRGPFGTRHEDTKKDGEVSRRSKRRDELRRVRDKEKEDTRFFNILHTHDLNRELQLGIVMEVLSGKTVITINTKFPSVPIAVPVPVRVTLVAVTVPRAYVPTGVVGRRVNCRTLQMETPPMELSKAPPPPAREAGV